jgi:RNA polymerase sigma factor (TIGR02999 family)
MQSRVWGPVSKGQTKWCDSSEFAKCLLDTEQERDRQRFSRLSTLSSQHSTASLWIKASVPPDPLLSAPSVHEITVILNRIEQGDAQAADQLLALVYDDLRRLASIKMARESAGMTLQPTALVHEAWLRLGGDDQPDWQNRAHFFAAAAEAMRRILIDRARSRQAVRHGHGLARLNVDDVELASATDDERVLAVNEALEKLALVEPKKAELVKLRYFAGLTLDEVAQTLGISQPTAKRWWTYARAWLFREIRL